MAKGWVRIPDHSRGLSPKLTTLPAAGAMVRAWWTAPVRYSARVRYFEQRGLLGALHVLIGMCAVLLATIPLVSFFAHAERCAAPGKWMLAGATVLALVWAGVWWFGPWPTRWWSLTFIIMADTAISLVALSEPKPLPGLLGLNLLLAVSVYAMFFDGPKTVVAHTVWSLVCVLTVVWEIATGTHADPYLAVSSALAAIVILGVAPVSVHFGIWVLRGEADAAMTDALTGLLNRRGLHLRLPRLLTGRHAGHVPADATVMILVIDLDQFKAINDTRGHAAGDAVLVRTGRRIKSATRTTALVARIGGEEFVVVDIVASQDVTTIADRVRSVISEPADEVPVTASIGVAVLPHGSLAGPSVDTVESIERAIDAADEAMFAVKRAGGNAASAVVDAGGDHPRRHGSG